MAKVSKVTINDFSPGIQTSARSNVIGAASMIRNFDIYEDSQKLIPLPTWESFTSTAEKSYNIVTLGGTNKGSTNVVGIGKAINNWYSANWAYRVLISVASAPAVTQIDYGYIDLSNMPAGFWTNVDENGDDIRLIKTNQQTNIEYALIDFNKSGNTGKLIIDGDQAIVADFYIYYGNANATAKSNLDSSTFWGSGVASAYPFDVDVNDYAGTKDLTSGATFSSAGGALIGSGTNNTTAYQGAGTGSGNYGNEGGVSFLYKFSTTPTGSIDLIYDSFATIKVQHRTDNKIRFYFNPDAEVIQDIISTTVLSSDTWYYISCMFDDDISSGTAYLYINGVEEGNVPNANFALESDPDADIYVNAGQSDSVMEFLTRSTTAKTASRVAEEDSMLLSNGSYWTIGSEVAFTSITPTYTGAQIYQRDLSESVWSEYTLNSDPVKHSSYHGFPSFLQIDGGIIRTIVNGNSSFTSTNYLTDLSVSGSTWNGTALKASAFIENIPRTAQGADKVFYFTDDQDDLNKFTNTTVTEDIFSTYAFTTCLTRFGQYLALGSGVGNRSYCQIWDTDSTTATEFIDFGNGDIQAVGDIFGTIFGVVNQNLTDNDLAGGTASKRATNIMMWNGGAYAEPFISLETYTSLSGYYSNTYEHPIMNHIEYIKQGFLFYARIPDIDGNIEEGFWAIGKSERTGRFGLSLYYDTSSLNDVTNFYRTGDVILAVHNRDGSISRITDNDYSNTSSWESVLYEGSGKDNKDKLIGVELDFEPLESGQSVSVYYKKGEDSSWTLIGTESTLNAIQRNFGAIEATQRPLPAFNEIQFKITSTGGKSAITGFGFSYESTSDVTN